MKTLNPNYKVFRLWTENGVQDVTVVRAFMLVAAILIVSGICLSIRWTRNSKQ